MDPRLISRSARAAGTALLLALSACAQGVAMDPAASTGEPELDSLRHEIRAQPVPMGSTLAFDSSRLPQGARGKFPGWDGDNFIINIPPRETGALAADQVLRETVVPLLQAMGYGDRVREIALPRARPRGDTLPTPDLAALSAQTCQEVEGDRYQRFHAVCQAMREGRSNPVAERVFQLAYGMSFAQFKADVERPRIEYVFTQRVDSIPIEHTGIVAARWAGETVTSVHGTVLSRYRMTNSARLSGPDAVERGQAQVYRMRGISPRGPQLERSPAELVLLPYGAAEEADGTRVAGLRYAWRTLLFAFPAASPARPGELLSWLAWIDAQDGQLLVLVPQFDNVGASGATWRRDPNTPTQVRFFQVDAESGGQYVLSRAGVFNRFDRLGNGTFGDGEVSISSTGPGSSATFAAFNLAPLNDAPNAVCASGGNNTFHQVHAYANLHSFRETLVAAGSFPTFPQAAMTVWTDMGGNSNSAGYDAFGTGNSLLRLAAGLGFASAACPDVPGGFLGPPPPMTDDPSVLPGSSDVTGMTHEFTHISTKRLQTRRPSNWCGMAVCPMPDPLAASLFHDYADAWAQAYASSPCMAGWYRKNSGGADAAENCATHHEGGYLPRLSSIGEPFSTASLLDHFPERRAALTGDYSDMQIVTTALWLTRQGMRSKCLPSGTAQYWVRLNLAMYEYGFLNSTCMGCDRDIYRYGQNFLQQMVQQWATAGQPGGPMAFLHNGAHTTNKVLSGWARVGIFLTPSTCIDGNAATGDPTVCPVAGGGEMGGDAIVDVWDNDAADDNVLDGITHPEFDYAQRGDPPPTFRVWTGPRYRFNASGVASSFTPSAATPSPCHTQYQVELSDTPLFTTIVSSGWLAASATAQPECYGTWTPPAANWTTLGGVSGDVKVYYRVRTRDGAGLNEKLSTQPGSGAWTVPPAYVIVNGASFASPSAREATAPGGSTRRVTCDGMEAERCTRCVAFTKSASVARKMSTNVCGLRSTSGNHVLCTCTMMRCPRRKVWCTSGISKAIRAGSPGTNGSGRSGLLR
jgi:hypothetical protein